MDLPALRDRLACFDHEFGPSPAQPAPLWAQVEARAAMDPRVGASAVFQALVGEKSNVVLCVSIHHESGPSPGQPARRGSARVCVLTAQWHVFPSLYPDCGQYKVRRFLPSFW